MAKKDPFSHMGLPDDDHDHQSTTAPGEVARENEDVTAGSPPRNLMRNLTKIGVPVLAISVIIYLFSSPDPKTRKRLEPQKVEVDDTRQIADTGALINRLKEDAAKPKKQEAEKTPVPAQAAGTSVTTPVPNAAAQADMAEVAKQRLDAQKRLEEIRASPLEAGTVKLLTDEGKDQGKQGNSRLNDVQAELATFSAQRAGALNAQKDAQAAQLKALAANAEKPLLRPKSADQEFIDANAQHDKAPQLVLARAPLTQDLINEGTIIRTVLLTAVSSDLPGRVIAQVTSDVYDSNNPRERHVLIPKGSRLLGVYNSEVAVGQESILMAINRVILPNGVSVDLSGAIAANPNGQSGVSATVNNNFMKMFSTSLILGGVSLLLPKSDSQVTTTGGGTGSPQSAGSTFAISLNDTLKAVLERNKRVAPTLSLAPGKEFAFLVAKDIAMPAYRP